MLIPLGKGKFSRLRPSPTHCFWLWWIVCFLYFLFISLFICWFALMVFFLLFVYLFDYLVVWLWWIVWYFTFCLFPCLLFIWWFGKFSSLRPTHKCGLDRVDSLLMPKLHFPGNTSNNFFGRYTWLSISRFLPFFMWVCASASVCLCRCVCVSVWGGSGGSSPPGSPPLTGLRPPLQSGTNEPFSVLPVFLDFF